MTHSKSYRFRRTVTVVVAVAAAFSIFLVGTRARTPSPDQIAATRVARGEYLVTVGGCNDCHTPWVMGEEGPEPDMTRTLSGHPHDFPLAPMPSTRPEWAVGIAETNTAFSGPWGVSFAANLSPCPDTGTGAWTEEIFINTLRSGKHWGQSRPILPPMPWFNYGKMTDEDLRSVFAYLRSLPPQKNPVPQPLLPTGEPMFADGWN